MSTSAAAGPDAVAEPAAQVEPTSSAAGGAAPLEPEAGNAIHGLVRWQLDVAEREPPRPVRTTAPAARLPSRSSCRSSTRFRQPASAYKHGDNIDLAMPLRQQYAPLPDGRTQTIDPVVLRAPAEPCCANAHGVPTGRGRSTKRARLPGGQAIGTTKLDHAFTDLERDAAARPGRLRPPDGDGGLELSVDEAAAG